MRRISIDMCGWLVGWTSVGMVQVRNKDGLKFDAFRTLSLNESAKPHCFIVSECGNVNVNSVDCKATEGFEDAASVI